MEVDKLFIQISINLWDWESSEEDGVPCQIGHVDALVRLLGQIPVVNSTQSDFFFCSVKRPINYTPD